MDTKLSTFHLKLNAVWLKSTQKETDTKVYIFFFYITNMHIQIKDNCFRQILVALILYEIEFKTRVLVYM